ncbi:MAG: choice-of-anchor Q domain-containing protein [Candidatus Electrothrix communis]|nr:hypothetical protein [Desulfobulbus sp. US4]WLE96349.1 MAG: choice-of-anchor Q domain-containing protein [Candidatus Electrothrix communis]
MKRQRMYLFFFIVLLAADAGYAQAADITVDGTTCILADAITAANTNANAGGCVGSGSYGNDTIFLTTDVLLTAQLPVITSTIIIEGQGYTIDGNDDSAVGSVLRTSSAGHLTMNKTTITGGNREDNLGGGIYNNGTVILTNVTISGNTAKGGGGIYNNGFATLILTNSMVSGNSTKSANDTFGGGIYNSYGIVTLTRSIVSDNTANNGGGICNGDGTITVINSTVSGNTAYSYCFGTCFGSASAGGIYNYSGTVTLMNSTVSENTAYASSSHGSSYGGGIFNYGTVTLVSSIISDNWAYDGGYEIYSFEGVGTINADNFNLFGTSSRSNAYAFDGFTPGSSDITATSDGTDPTALEAIFLPLADNGGPTLTHALVKGSPAIDLDAGCATGLSEDQRGEPRPVGDGCDAGAFEGTISFSNNGFLPAVYLLLF